jgi:hypothetical protein
MLAAPGAMAQKVAFYQCKWQPGISNENEEDLINRMHIHEKSQISYLISNDENTLFIDLILAEKASIQKVLRFGLTTWINPEAKQKKGLGIQFPVEPDGSGEPAFRRDKGGDRKEMMLAMMAMKNQEMVLIGFGGQNERVVIDPRVDPLFHGMIEMLEGGKLKVSLSLPLEKIGCGPNVASAGPISIGFETGYLDVTGQGAPSGGSMQGGGGMHGGGMPGGGGPPPGMAPGESQTASSGDQQKQPDIGELASPTKMWIKQVKLAEKP